MNVETIGYDKIQELVMQVPMEKLPILYNMLIKVIKDDVSQTSFQEEFILLPILKRQEIMRRQAKQMLKHYNNKALEREEWQSGEFIEY